MIGAVLNTGWDYRLVTLSVFIAMIGSYIALDCVAKMRTAANPYRAVWLTAGVLIMGLAIWSMYRPTVS